MTISVSKAVNVRIVSAPTFPTRRGFGTLMLVTNGTALPAGDRVRAYASADDVAADGHAGRTLEAAQVFFSQSPKPTQLLIGRRFAAPTAAELAGGVNASRLVSTYNAVTNGALSIPINGATVALSGINLSSATTLAGVAALIQAALTTAASGATIEWTGQRFLVRSPTTGVASTIGFATAPGAGTDLAPLLALRAEDLGRVTAGAAQEDITASLDALEAANAGWYGFALVDDVAGYATVAQVLEAAAWAEARVKVFGYTTNNSDVLDAASTTDIASQLAALGRRRTVGFFSTVSSTAAVSFMARMFAVNFDEPRSMITGKFKQLPGIVAEPITEAQRQTLNRKRINYYTRFGDTAIVAESWMANGTFFDEVHGLDWLQNDMQTEVFGFLVTRTTKVPQTDAGVATIMQQVTKSCLRAVDNGLLAPGTWEGDDIGPLRAGDFLERGFFVFANSVAVQARSEREARRSPPILVAAKGAGAIHNVDITLTFER